MLLIEFLYKTLIDLALPMKSGQKIIKIAVVFFQAQALKETLVVDLDSLKACLFQRKVEVCRAADILVAVQRVVAVGLI